MTRHAQGPTMQIGELAERTGLSQRTIRHYDEVGLLPASRTEGGFRVYTETDVQRLAHIKQMKPLGFTLEEMAELLHLLATTPPTSIPAQDPTGDPAAPAGTTSRDPVDAPTGAPAQHPAGDPAAPAGTPAGDPARVRLAGYLDRARPERDKLARKLTQADEFITMLEHRLHP